MTDLSRLIAVKPIITYPREVQIGKTYLMTIDLQPEEKFDWRYGEEEYPIYCTVNSNLISSNAVGEPVIVLHRFGGNYGEAKFLLSAVQGSNRDELKVALINVWGAPIKAFSLAVEIKQNIFKNEEQLSGYYHFSENTKAKNNPEIKSSFSSSPFDLVSATQHVAKIITDTLLELKGDFNKNKLSRQVQQQIFSASQRYVENYIRRYCFIKILVCAKR